MLPESARKPLRLKVTIFTPVPEASQTTALLLSVGGGSVSESNRSAAFGPLSGFEDHAHHRMKYAPEYSLAAARTSHGNEPVDTFWATPKPTANPPPPPTAPGFTPSPPSSVLPQSSSRLSA